MKNKKSQKVERPFHLHMEYFFRHQYCMVGMLGLMLMGVMYADSKMLSVMKDAYMHGFGIVGQYLREETGRNAESVNIGLRTPTISGE